MDDFETFKASREKIDPSTKKFTERQWQKAYAAYCSARERVNEGGHSKSSNNSKRRRRSTKAGATQHTYSHGPLAQLRNEVRQNSAYNDLRMVLDLLAWIAIGLVVFAAGVKLAYYTDGSAAVIAVLNAAVRVVAIVALRFLAHVIIDIPDIALHKRLPDQDEAQKADGRQ